MTDESIDPYYEAQIANDANYHASLQPEIRTIHYGFGKDYLPTWGLKEAFREIFQNFLDYGEYHVSTMAHPEVIGVAIQNGWQPNSLDFLRIGYSKKEKSNAIGKHGEGLKMAFLILLREGLTSTIVTPTHQAWPEVYADPEIGECFCIRYQQHEEPIDTPFTINFTCPADIFNEFYAGIIRDEDVIYHHYEYGDLVDKPAGNIYSGGLFVTNLEGIGRSYNINPAHLPLDRDRSVPHAFDVEYATSIILQASEKMTVKDLSYSDTRYIHTVPPAMLSSFKPRRVGNNIEFTVKGEDGTDKVVSNSNLKEALKAHSFFAKAIMGIKRFLSKQLGLYDMLEQFQKKHNYMLNSEMKADLELILLKAKGE